MLVTKLPSWQAESRMHRMLHNKLLELLHLVEFHRFLKWLELLHLVEYHRFLSPMWQ